MGRRQFTLWTAVVFLSACAAPSRSTRLTIDDLNQMAHAMAQSLSGQHAIRQRGRDSPPWIVSIDQVRNLSNDVISDGERWALLARLRGMLPLRELADRRNMTFVIPAERRDSLRDYLREYELETGFAIDRYPTHQMTATIRSIPRAQAQRRSELYHCQFEIIQIGTGQIVWSDVFEFKRTAVGHIWD